MASGRYRERIVFQTMTNTPDGAGGEDTSWGSDIPRWGDWRPERGLERVEAGRIEAPLAGVLKVHYDDAVAALTEEARVLIKDRVYNIRSIEPDRKNRTIEMVVERQVAT